MLHVEYRTKMPQAKNDSLLIHITKFLVVQASPFFVPFTILGTNVQQRFDKLHSDQHVQYTNDDYNVGFTDLWQKHIHKSLM